MKIKTKSRRAKNYGSGDLFDFHGAFTEKKDAVAKERKVPGAFIKPAWFRSGMRYGVFTARNPRVRRVLLKKQNVEWGTYEKGVFHPWTRRPKTRRKPAKRRLNANADTRFFEQALKKLFPGKTVPLLTTAQLSQVLRYAQELKAGKKNPPRRGNPTKRNYADATELYTQFHGRGPKGVKDVQVHADDYDSHKELSQLGRLVSLTIGAKSWRKKIEWGSREAPDLAAAPNGKQLYIIGGVQNLNGSLTGLPVKALGKDRVLLGDAYRIEYFTQKGFDNFQPVTYWHDLGEETGKRPRLVYDKRKKRIHLVGGGYKVKPEGIVN
jgi:hypothetical protein